MNAKTYPRMSPLNRKPERDSLVFFKHQGICGSVDRSGFVLYGGCGFHVENATQSLKDTISRAAQP